MAANDRLRIVHLTHGLDMGGQEKLLVEFARHADRDRFDLLFLSLGSDGVLAPDIEACGWPVVQLDCPEGFRPGLVLRLARLFRHWRAHLIHTHEDRPFLHGTLAAYLAGVVAVHTRHGRSPNLTRRQTFLINQVARLTHRFVCVSRDSRERTIEHGLSPDKVPTIWNGIDLARFPCSGPVADGPVVSVGRLSPEKDHAMLLQAAARAVAHDPHFRLEIAGDGVCREDLEQLVDQLGLRNHVHLLGQVRDIRGLLARASLFVLPSLSEGLSLTLLEAMACGLPVVATRVGGNVEVVREGKTGLLVPAAEPARMAEALVQLRRDPARGRTLGQSGRQRVEQHFDIRRMVADYEALYAAAYGSAPQTKPQKTAATPPPVAVHGSPVPDAKRY